NVLVSAPCHTPLWAYYMNSTKLPTSYTALQKLQRYQVEEQLCPHFYSRPSLGILDYSQLLSHILCLLKRSRRLRGEKEQEKKND
ncbi:mCG145410, partial [Mus musculus]